MDTRKKRVLVAVLAGAVLLVLGLAWLFWIPALVRGRVEAAAAERLGMDASVGGVSLGLWSVTLDDVELRGREGGLTATVAEVDLDAGLFSLALSGASSIDRVDASDVRIAVDLGASGAEESFARLREALVDRASGPSGEGGGASERRELSASGVEATVRDATGDLLVVHGGTVERTSDGALSLAAAALAVGGPEGHHLSLSDLTGALARGEDGTLALTRAAAGAGELVWVPRPADEDPDAARPRTLARLIRLAGVIRSPDAAETAPEPDDGRPGWVRRLASGATLELANATVRQGDDVVLERLTATATHRGDGRLHFQGSGSPGSGGALRWDLELSPLELRGEGTVSFHGLPLALVAPLLSDIPWYEPERARLDGELELSGSGAEPISISGRLTVRDAALYSERIAPEPVTGITVTVEGEGTFHSDERRLEVSRATVTMGEARASIAGALEWAPDHYLVDVTATLPSTDCSAAVGAIPHDLLADLTGFSWSGRIGGRVVAHVDSRALEETRLDIDVADGCQFQTVPAAADLRRVQGPFLHRVLEPDGTWFEMTTGPGTGNWTSIVAMSPFFVQAVVAHEDASFFRHGGFAPWAIRDALTRNLEVGRYAVGASTITMQLAKNLFLHREKTLARKVQEVLLTWWLESALDKSAILELYLNVIEYGPAVYGIRNAAEHYFGRDPSELSPAESAFLANVLPNPKLYHGQYERNELSNSMKNRMQRLLRHMHARGRIDDAALEYGLAEIETFRFHHEGEPLPDPREIPGSAGTLPIGSARSAWVDPWEAWDDDGYEDEEVPPAE